MESGKGVAGVNRADIHNACARLWEEWQQFFDQEECAPQIHIHDPVPISHRYGINRFVELDACIVDQDVDTIVKLSNCIYRVLNLCEL